MDLEHEGRIKGSEEEQDMPEFMDEDFLLESEAARRLYHDYAEGLPVIDYHSHLSVDLIAEDANFENLSRAWLAGDHYKWRAMRANGISEDRITGSAADRDKLQAWAETVPKCLGNPLYHWSHLELKRYFGFRGRAFGPDSAEELWNRAGGLLKDPSYSTRALLKMMNVRLLCTTDDPADSLDKHKMIAEDPSFDIKVLPTFRPDKALAVENIGNYQSYLKDLGNSSGIEIGTYRDLLSALEKRFWYFHDFGARISDHALLYPIASLCTDSEAEALFTRLLRGEELGPEEAEQFKTAVLLFLHRLYYEHGWTSQLHISALRNVNRRMYEMLGPDTGYDCIEDSPLAASLAAFLDQLAREMKLPKTILYSLNGKKNEVLAAVAGCFQDGSIPGKMQLGSAWWFMDTKEGMEDQLRSLANIGLLSRFVGMLTDSRSFLSFPRHEYFRRVLCNLIGSWMEAGLIPRDYIYAGGIVRDISYNNAVSYFGFNIEEGR